MMDIDVTYYPGNIYKHRIEEVIEILNQIQSHFTFHRAMSNRIEICDEEVIKWNSFRDRQPICRHRCVIFITEKPFSDRWFSHEESQYSVLSINDWNNWENRFPKAPLELYLIYQIAQAAINFAAGLSERKALRMMHEETTGCMFDKCRIKDHLVVGMAMGKICDQCRAVLSTTKLDNKALKAVENMLVYVRDSMSIEIPNADK